jgi:hypothetical protein
MARMPVDNEELKMRARETAKFLKEYDELADADVIAKKEKLVCTRITLDLC